MLHCWLQLLQHVCAHEASLDGRCYHKVLCYLQYHNVFALVKEMGIPHPFTDWTTSGFWSPRGLTTEAPVFSKQQQYPTLLGQFIHTFPLFRYVFVRQVNLCCTQAFQVTTKPAIQELKHVKVLQYCYWTMDVTETLYQSDKHQLQRKVTHEKHLFHHKTIVQLH